MKANITNNISRLRKAFCLGLFLSTTLNAKKYYDEIKISFTGIEFRGTFIATDQMNAGD